MKKLFNLFAAFISLAVGFTACEVSTTPSGDQEHTIALSANKSEIMADGADAVTFETTIDGVVTAEGVQIICLNDNSVLSNSKFSTTTAGDYRFVAVYNGKKSEEVKVTAKALKVEVALTVDKSEIVADNTDAATFTVTVGGEDKTAEATILVVNYGTALEGNSFTTDVAGDFIFQANFEGTQSNQVIITATGVEQPVQKNLTLTATPMRIKADGTEQVTFKAMYGEDDVTATCEIKSTNGVTVENGVFTTTEAGTYNFYALYDNVRSNTVSIDAYDPEMKTDYEIGQIYELSGSKGVCYAIKTDNQNRTWAYFFSMDEEYLQWSTENVWCNCASGRGDWNTEDMLKNGTSPEKYPAAQWCVAHGEGWFMPSSTELQWMWDAVSGGTHSFDCDTMKAYNKLLKDNGGEAFQETYYWSSNETSDDMIELIAFMADSVVCLEPYKTYNYNVRAAYRVRLD